MVYSGTKLESVPQSIRDNVFQIIAEPFPSLNEYAQDMNKERQVSIAPSYYQDEYEDAKVEYKTLQDNILNPPEEDKETTNEYINKMLATKWKNYSDEKKVSEIRKTGGNPKTFGRDIYGELKFD